MTPNKTYKYYVENKRPIYIKLGQVEEQYCVAGYAVEVQDYVGNIDHLVTQRITIGGSTYGLMGYKDKTKLHEVPEKEFDIALSDELVYLVENNSDNDAFYLSFKVNDARRTILKFLLNNKKLKGTLL